MRFYGTFENRKSAFIAVKLLALSLEKHCQNFTLYLGVSEQEAELSEWLIQHAPHVVLIQLPPFAEGSSLKHVKALLILNLFERGITDVTWLDTDLLVLRDLEPLLASLSDDTLLVAQEGRTDEFEFNRTLLQHYQLQPVRALEYYVNTCVLRVTTHHIALIKKYLACLLDPLFVEQQSRSIADKLPDFAFEQNIMEMLLSSGDDQWTPTFPVRFLRDGSGIIQELGVTTYSLRNRLLNGLGFNRPWLVHVPAIKPWDSDARSRTYRAASVYSTFADTYRDQVTEDMSWVNSAGASSRIARLLSFGVPHWVGWAHCLAGKIRRFLQTGSTRRSA